MRWDYQLIKLEKEAFFTRKGLFFLSNRKTLTLFEKHHTLIITKKWRVAMVLSIAVSGRGVAGLLAYYALEEIKEMGIEFELYAASGTSALACIVFLSSIAKEKQIEVLNSYANDLNTHNSTESIVMQFAIDKQLQELHLDKELYITSADIDSGVLFVFNKNLTIDTPKIKTVKNFTYPQAVKATSALGGLDSVFAFEGKRLVDSYFKTKTPQFPLRFQGAKKILSLDIYDNSAHWYNFFYPEMEEKQADCNLQFSFDKIDITDKKVIEEFKEKLRQKRQFIYNKLILDS